MAKVVHDAAQSLRRLKWVDEARTFVRIANESEALAMKSAAEAKREAAQAEELGSATHASSNRTCELGLTAATGKDYEHILEILERVSR